MEQLRLVVRVAEWDSAVSGMMKMRRMKMTAARNWRD